MTGEKLEVYFSTDDCKSFWTEVYVVPKIGEYFRKRGRQYEVIRVIHDYDEKMISVAGVLCD